MYLYKDMSNKVKKSIARVFRQLTTNSIEINWIFGIYNRIFVSYELFHSFESLKYYLKIVKWIIFIDLMCSMKLQKTFRKLSMF